MLWFCTSRLPYRGSEPPPRFGSWPSVTCATVRLPPSCFGIGCYRDATWSDQLRSSRQELAYSTTLHTRKIADLNSSQDVTKPALWQLFDNLFINDPHADGGSLGYCFVYILISSTRHVLDAPSNLGLLSFSGGLQRCLFIQIGTISGLSVLFFLNFA